MKPLRLLPLLVFFCCLFNSSRAQYVTIPDTAFVSYLQNNFPACMNGSQMDTTCQDITDVINVYINNLPIRDLTGIQYFDNMGLITCEYDSLEYIPSFPANCTSITIWGNPLLTGIPALPASLMHLDVAGNPITALPALPATLLTLDCTVDRLTALPTLPPALRDLRCSFNQLTTLPALPATLETLFCGDNALTVLPALPSNLRWLECHNNNLTAIPALGPHLLTLRCGNAQFGAIPSLPDSLTDLHVVAGSFTTVPALPLSLKVLVISDAPLSSLPALPDSLSELAITYTPLTALPALPAKLRRLDCSNNQLTALPALPDSLAIFYCSYNQLTALPPLPARCGDIMCDNNRLTYLPQLPDYLYRLMCAANPDMHCLPRLTTIMSFAFDDSAIACLPNYGHVFSCSPPLNSKPLCDPFNASGCPVYWNISGSAYNDLNGNCVQDNGEAYVLNCKVNLLQNDTVVQQAYTSLYGTYAFETAAGNYTVTVDTAAVPFNIVCPANGLDSATVTLVDSASAGLNFGLQCKPGFDVGLHAIGLSSRARPAAFSTVQVVAMDMARLYGQTCNTANISGQLVLTFSGPATYLSPAAGALTPIVGGNTLTYTVNDWSAVSSDAFDFKIQVDTTAQLGQQICFDATVTPTIGDNNPTNNHLTWCAAVVNSFDPNIKEAYPVGTVDIMGDHWLTYTVRFQNTGNAPAEHIYITDTIDTDVDIETFQLLAYSFQPQVIIKGNAVRFNFANINLPDSVSDEPNSHGYVQYKVRAKNNLQSGTNVTNTAFIYFDFNAPVITNTTSTIYSMVEGITAATVSNVTLQLYPNPANDMVMINLSDNFTGGTLTLSDVTGRSLNAIAITSTHNQLNTGALSSGVYLVTAVKGGERVVQRLVVSR